MNTNIDFQIAYANIIEQKFNTFLQQYEFDATDLNREIIDDYLDNMYTCINVIKVFSAILNYTLNKTASQKSGNLMLKQLNYDKKTWLTDIQSLVQNSAQGDVARVSYRYLNDKIIMKVPKFNTKTKSYSDRGLIHEFMIGSMLLELRKTIPNFMAVYAIYRTEVAPGNSITTDTLLSEFVKGKTLDAYLKIGKITNEELTNVIIQVCLSLQMAFDKFQFVHYDLHCGNIMLRERKDIEQIKYTINGDDSYVLTPRFIATIIDYGYSGVVNTNETTNISTLYRFATFHHQLGFYESEITQNQLPGLDLAKLFLHMFWIIQHNNQERKYIDLYTVITQTYQQLGIQLPDFNVVSRNAFYPPAPYNDRLCKMQPVEFLYKFIEQPFVKNFADNLILKSPHLGNIILCDTECQLSRQEILKNMTTINNTNEACRGDPWKSLSGNWKDKHGIEKYWFDCGKFYFDGTYNVVSFPKGMSMYHGSYGSAFYNILAPLGMEYYDTKKTWLSDKDLQNLRSDNISDIAKENIIKDKSPAGHVFFGDKEIAIQYSNKEDKNGDRPCGKNCILAFKLKKEVMLVNLNDPYNLLTLLSSDISILSQDMKKELAYIYSIITSTTVEIPDLKNVIIDLRSNLQNLRLDDSTKIKIQNLFAPLTRYNMYSSIDTFRGNDYKMADVLLLKLNKSGYSGFCNPKTVAYNTKNPHIRFAEIVLGKDVFDYVERDFSNKADWQYFDNKRLFGEIGKLITDFKKYKTFNVNFHQGDLYAHSVWTALYVQNEFKIPNNIWTTGISDDYMPLCAIIGFLHDIGKAGDNVYNYYDKINHPTTGFEYIHGTLKYKFGENKVLDIDELFKNLMIHISYKPILEFCILGHWEFGDHVRRYKDALKANNTAESDRIPLEYVNKGYEMAAKCGITDFEQFIFSLRVLILISVCDIKGSEVYIDEAKIAQLKLDVLSNPNHIEPELNAYLKYHTYITNVPKSHRGNKNYDRFELDKYGKLFYQQVFDSIMM